VTGPVNWQFSETNQATTKNHQRKTPAEKAKPRRAAQIRKKIQDARRESGNDSNESNVPMLKERPQTPVVFLCLHSAK